MITKPEICYECRFLRRLASDPDHLLCVHPKAYYCNRQGVLKATRACHLAELNPQLPELYPNEYKL